ncbi:MAG: hypothetical protein KBD64_03990 [Gammaproteobacteria bacterium]|nr:hypothetical protein [Gammaproteobacteria bacterium]
MVINNNISIAPTCVASWQSLVQEAGHKSHLYLNEDLESYLIFLLIRFTKNTQLASSILALEYLETHNIQGSAQREHLRDLGDKCLLFAGFYPEQAHRRLVSLPYFVNLGRDAYDQIAKKTLNSNQLYEGLNNLFNQLAINFVNLLSILQQIKLLNRTHSWLPDEITKYEQQMLAKTQANKVIIMH